MSFLFFDCPLLLDFDLPRLCPLSFLLPLFSVCNRELELEDSPLLLLLMSSFKIKSRMLSNVSLVVPDALLTAVTVPDQLSGKDDKRSKACTSSSNFISTEAKREIIELNSFM
ncbi:hypothetical protein HanHA300_Chr07g0229891 [Helianthus annuus]|nr:hypothetical protein HanHA300_Chr07g0229891 [Helianthus annuus]KAJ0555367.1 hypothetical protein HanIR_Chr07g0301271 [Helianthus annuus]KAJ0562069.1 hypothetical protein HanHA89_Chr07g0247031 [Helianthus annuus]KAJ0727448.1 hypothetical protein HanLR1_Chr07g0229891 [Helianthus annuus]